MRFRFIDDIPEAPERDWFESRFAELRAALDATDDGADPSRWVDLAEHWNEVKAVLSGENSRRSWAESLDAGSATAGAAAARYRNEVAPLATNENAAVRRRFLASEARAAVEARFGATLTSLWDCDEVAADPRNVDLDTEAGNLFADYSRLRALAQIDLDGTPHTLTQLTNLGEAPDPRLRRAAFDALGAFYREQQGEFDRIYSRLVELRTESAARLGFDNYVPLGYQRMSRVDYGPAEVTRFREAIATHVVPLLAKVRAAQARDLGTPSVSPWDRAFFPASALPTDVVPLDGQLASARAVYEALHPRLAGHFDHMVAHGFVDLGNRPGKRPGAFCTAMPDRREVRIFCNSTGSASDVGTLLHESGHAFQGWESIEIPLCELQWPSYEACEIHSMGMEMLAFPHLAAFFSPDDAQRFRRQRLTETVTLLCYIAVVDAFQHTVYECPQMTPDELATLWSGLWAEFMVGEDWTGHEDALARRWQRQLHIFGMPFYYIDYALAETCALQLLRFARLDQKDAMDRYLRLCQVGGTRSFLRILEEGGLASPFDPATLPPLVEMVAGELGL